jgi:TPR repeat protein
MVASGERCCSDARRLAACVERRVAARQAAATPEGFHARGQREYSDGLHASAAESWARAVELQHRPSYALLCSMLMDGRPGVAVDCARAFELASAAAGMGCAHGKGALGRCYHAGYGVAEDHAKAVALGRESAAAGSCTGQFVVARALHSGRGAERDDEEAGRIWRLAAEQGYAPAQYNLGHLCQNIFEDNAEAVRWYRLAALQGIQYAQCNLAAMLSRGDGVVQDKTEAERLYRLAGPCKRAVPPGHHAGGRRRLRAGLGRGHQLAAARRRSRLLPRVCCVEAAG